MGWADDLSNSMGLNVTPVYGASYGGGGYGWGDAGAISAAIARAREEADREYDLRKQQSKQQYQASMMSARTAQDAQRATAKYQQQQYELARDRLAFDREVQAQEFGLKQAGMAYNLIQTGAQLHNNPLDYFNEAEWARGVAGRPETSTFLSALQNNTRLPDFQARGAPAEVNSLDALTAKLGGGAASGGAAPGGSEANYLAQIGNIGVKGPHQLGAGALEQLTPTERSLFTAGLSKLGYDPNTFLTGYARSRIGQGLAGSAAA